MNSNAIYTFLLIGIIIGPLYSIVLFNDYSGTALKYKAGYYEPQKSSDLMINIIPNVKEIVSNSVSVYHHSVYALFSSKGNNNSVYTSNGTYLNLLEFNYSSDFKSIIATGIYSTPFLSNDYFYYSKPIFNGSEFWTICRTPTLATNASYHISFISFTKEGTILSNHTIALSNPSTSINYQEVPDLLFLGISNGYFFIDDVDNNTLVGFSTFNYFETFGMAYSSITTASISRLANIDGQGMLWFEPMNGKSAFEAVSISDLHPLSSPYPIIKSAIANDFATQNPGNNSFIETPIYQTQTYPFISAKRLTTLQYAEQNGSSQFIEGITNNYLTKINVPFLNAFISFLGYVLVISEVIIIKYYKV